MRSARTAGPALLLGALLSLAVASAASAAPGDLTAERFTNFTGAGGAGQPVNVGGVLLFAADDGVSGDELWKTDGTAAGTVLVEDINPGTDDNPPSPDDSEVQRITAVGTTAFFEANDGVTGQELWKSEPPYTAATTSLVADINAGDDDDNPGVPDPSDLRELTNFNGVLMFSANDGLATGGQELWRSNGGPLGAGNTEMVEDINPGTGEGEPGEPDGSEPTALTVVGTTLFFNASNGILANGRELWKSGGAAANTDMIEINSGTDESSPGCFANIGGVLYFSAFTNAAGVELWKSNGGALGAGTEMVEDINTNSGGAASSSPCLFTPLGSNFFFRANNGSVGEELWKSDGTAAGTDLFADIHPTGSSQPNTIRNVGGTLFFTAADNIAGLEVWKSDGTPGGTQMVADINPGSAHSNPTFYNGLTTFIPFSGFAFFDALDATHGSELWMSDGGPLNPGTSNSGTRMVRDINPGGADSFAQGLTPFAGTLYFLANDGTNGFELWRIVPEPAPSTPSSGNPAENPECQPLRDKIQKLSKRSKRAEDPDVKAKLRKKRRNARNQLAALGCP